ncbi:hypothetical protein AOLI_G00049940 [Acnodon oligacanthus]
MERVFNPAEGTAADLTQRRLRRFKAFLSLKTLKELHWSSAGGGQECVFVYRERRGRGQSRGLDPKHTHVGGRRCGAAAQSDHRPSEESPGEHSRTSFTRQPPNRAAVRGTPARKEATPPAQSGEEPWQRDRV